jgi:hypothetical protein
MLDGEIIEQGELPLLNTPPHGSAVVTIPCTQPDGEPGAARWLTVSFSLARAAAWAPRGHEVAWAQFELPARPAPAPIVKIDAMPRLRVAETAERIEVEGEDFLVVFDRWTGAIASWEHAGMRLIEPGAGPQLQVWRAPTDNDVHIAREWRKAGYDRLMRRVERAALRALPFRNGARPPGAARVDVDAVLNAHGVTTRLDCQYSYTVYGTGDIVVSVALHPGPGLPVLPRAALEMRVPGRFDRFAWHGRGPHESYIDRKESARIGVYEGSVDDQFVPYIFPQENGLKSDARWATLSDARGRGLCVLGMPLINVAALRYTAADLTQARHLHELTRREDIVLTLDYRHNGLGSNSCGPAPLARYLLPAEPMAFRVRLTPFTGEALPASAYLRTQLESLD